MLSSDGEQKQITAGAGGYCAKPQSTVDRVAFLDQLLCKRLEEVEAAEARLQKRLDQVGQAEQRLVNLQSALSQSTTAAGAMVAELTEFREKAHADTTTIIQCAKADLRKLTEVAEKTSANARELMDTLPRGVAARIEVLKAEVQRTLSAAQTRVASQCEEFEHKAMVFEEWLQTQINNTRESLESLSARAVGAVAREWQERATSKLCEQETRVMTLISSLESRMGELVGAFEKELFSRAGAIQSQLDGSIEEAEISASNLAARVNHKLTAYEQGADSVVRMVESVLRQAMHDMHERAVAATAPMLRELEAELLKDLKISAESINHTVAAKAAEVRRSLDEHIEELCAAGESLFESAEQRLGQRIRDIRPEAAAALDSAADMLNQRLTQMLASARSMVELTESQLQRRIEGLGSRATTAMRAMEAELAAKLAQVEQETHTATTQLEQQLITHAQNMIERERRAIGPQIPSKGQLEVFLKEPKPKPDSAAA
jgi:hypothetical protein